MFSGFYECIERNYHEELVSGCIMHDLACRHNLIKMPSIILMLLDRQRWWASKVSVKSLTYFQLFVGCEVLTLVTMKSVVFGL
jgi:hypothetical protein